MSQVFDTQDAKCREVDPELFFPEHTQTKTEVKVILSLCSNCPVFTQCYDYALKNDVIGWWAGTTYNERIKIRKQKKLRANPLIVLPQDLDLADNPDAVKMRRYRERKRKQRENERMSA